MPTICRHHARCCGYSAGKQIPSLSSSGLYSQSLQQAASTLAAHWNHLGSFYN